jgi:hypothetical protein
VEKLRGSEREEWTGRRERKERKKGKETELD